MMMLKNSKLFALLVVSAAASLAAAQFSALPECGSTCAGEAASSNADCSATDMRCLCNNNAFVDAVYACLPSSCDFPDENSSIGHLGSICAAAASAPATSTTPGATTTGATSSSTTPGATTTTTTTPGSSASTTPSASDDADSPEESESASESASATDADAPTTPTTTATRSFTTQPAAGAGTTRAPNNANVGPSTSTQVVVQTVGANGSGVGANGEQVGGVSQGGNILNGAGASGVRVGSVVGAVLVALVALL